MAPTIYHLGISQSDRIVWAAEELGMDYEFKRFDRAPSRLAPDEYKNISPTGTAPVISDTYNGKEIKIAETGAILEYFDQIYGKGKLSIAPGQDGYNDYLFYLHFANSSLMSAMTARKLLEGGKDSEANFGRIFSERLDVYYPMIDKFLSENKYFGGDKFTIADINMFFPLTTMRAFVEGINYDKYPHIREYIKRISQRPAYQTASKKADPDFKPPLE